MRLKYTAFQVGEEYVAGAMERTLAMGSIPPHWAVYFAVKSADAASMTADDSRSDDLRAPPGYPWDRSLLRNQVTAGRDVLRARVSRSIAYVRVRFGA